VTDEPIIRRRPKRTARSQQQLNLLIFAIAVLLCIGFAVYYFFVPRDEEFILKSYRYAEVQERSFRQLVSTEGTVVPKTSRTLLAPAQGTVTQLQAAAGQDVVEGQILCVIDSPTLESQLTTALRDLQAARVDAQKLELDNQVKITELEAGLRAAEQKVNDTSRMLEVYEQLYLLGDASRSELENHRRAAEDAQRAYEALSLTYEATKEKYAFDVDVARFKVTELEQRVADLENSVESLIVKSPISGRVLQVTVKEGDSVNANATMMSVADLATSLISAEIPVSALSVVRVGQPVSISMFGESHMGTVSYIAPQATAGATTVNLEVTFDALPQNVIPNAACYLDIEVSKKDAANSLPRDHYLASGESRYIYLLDEETKTARKVPARFGLVEGQYVEVLSGAQKGDLVIVSSYDEFIDRDQIALSEGGGTRI
jgi:HlyD family secretion protein